MKARQWNRKVTFRKLTAVSLGVMLALMSAGAQATVYESIDREGYDRVESDKVPIVITDDDVILKQMPTMIKKISGWKQRRYRSPRIGVW